MKRRKTVKKSKTWAKAIVPIVLHFFMLLVSGEALAQIQLRSDGISAFGGAVSSPSQKLLAAGGQPESIGTSSNPNHILISGFIPTIIPGVAGDEIIVWPGDMNNNGIANQADVLPLGLFFEKIGLPRQNASINWNGQPAAPWTPETATYADANGDGVVNQADVLAVGLNFDKTHTGSNSIAEQLLANGGVASGAATLKPEVNPPQPSPGNEFFILVQASEVTDLFGVSFELIYERPALLQILAVGADSMLGSEVIFFSNVDNSGGKVSVGITKKSGQAGANGAGSVVRIKAILTAQAQNGDIINLSLQNASANNASGQSIEMALQSSQIVVMTTAVASGDDARIITDYRLYQNHPNPFNPSTLIRYEIPKSGHVTVKVYNFVGKEVRTLMNEAQPAGAYQISWDGRDEHGRQVPSGIYFYHFSASSFVETRKMVLVR
jgi:hypothetical protein